MADEMAMPEGLAGSAVTTRKGMRLHGIGALGIELLPRLFDNRDAKRTSVLVKSRRDHISLTATAIIIVVLFAIGLVTSFVDKKSIARWRARSVKK